MLDKMFKRPTVNVIKVAEFKEPEKGIKKADSFDIPDVDLKIQRELEEFDKRTIKERKHRKQRLLLTGLTEDCGISGVKYVFGGSVLISRRALWIVVLLAAFVMTVMQISMMIAQYTKHPLNVNININYVEELTFPVVAVCNFNMMSKSETDEANITDLVTAMFGTYNPNFDNYNISGTDTKEWYLEMAHKRESTILYATWQRAYIPPSAFETIFTDFGVCYAFNTGNDSYGIRTVDNSGASYGLTMYLDTQPHEYNLGPRNGVGFQLVLYEQGDVPLVHDLGFAVSAAQETRVGVELQRITNLPPPHGICGSKTLKYFDKYTKNTCRYECFVDYLLAYCSCRMYYMPGNERICDLQESYECLLEAEYVFINSGHECDCPVPCSRTLYRADLSHAKWPSDIYSEFMAATMGLPKSFDENYAKVDIFFQQLSIEEIVQQKAYDFFSCLSDIGGSLGLWLGGSILTMIEIIDLILRGCFNKLWH